MHKLMYQHLIVGSKSRQKQLASSARSLDSHGGQLAKFGDTDVDWIRSAQRNTRTYLDGKELDEHAYKQRLEHYSHQGDQYKNLVAKIDSARQGEARLPGLLEAIKEKHGDIPSPRLALRPKGFQLRDRRLHSKSLPTLHALRLPGQAEKEQQRAVSLWDIKKEHLDRQLSQDMIDRKMKVERFRASGDKHDEAVSRAQQTSMNRQNSQYLLDLLRWNSGSGKYLKNFQKTPEREHVSRSNSMEFKPSQERVPSSEMRRVATGL